MFQKHFQNIALFLAFVLYGSFSSPTPDTISWAEIAIGLLLIIGIGFKKIISVFSGMALWRGSIDQRFLTACFLLALIPAALIGCLSFHPFNDLVRDLIPLGYFFLTVFLCDRDVEKPLLYGIVFTGVMFALRFWPNSGLTFDLIGQSRGDDQMLYLTSSPSVLFSGLYLLFIGTSLEKQTLWRRIGTLVLAMICLLTIAATLQRGAMLLSGLVIFGVFWHRLQRTPHFMYFCVVTLFVGGIWFGPMLIDLVDLVWHKTLEVGDNQRLAELHSVMLALQPNPWNFVFGLGWGATIVTAASTFADVRYTHMLFSYMLFKAGIIGLFALAGYAGFIGKRIIRQLPQRPLITCAALPSLILGFAIYPSFKMLCFGAIIALLTVIKINPENNS